MKFNKLIWLIGDADTFVTLSGTTEQLSAGIDMASGQWKGAHVIADIDFDAGPTDNVVVNIYGSLDGTNWDDTAAYSITIDKGTDPNQISVNIANLAYFRIGLVQDGSTDSHNVRSAFRVYR